jgi:hypothetical protein
VSTLIPDLSDAVVVDGGVLDDDDDDNDCSDNLCSVVIAFEPFDVTLLNLFSETLLTFGIELLLLTPVFSSPPSTE